MPGKRKRGDRLLEEALEALAGALNESGAPWMVIGGIAVIAHGVRRFTTDIDAAVRGDAIRAEELLEVFERHGIIARIPDALPFAEANLVLLLRHEETGVELDVSLAWSAFEHEALKAPKPTPFGRVQVPMCSPEELIVFKAIAGRAKDGEDAEALLALYPEIDVERVRHRVAELAALAETPEILETFDALLATSTPRTEESPTATSSARKSRQRKRR